MKRQVDLNEISDGRLYGSNDMVKADCGGCEGCSACCRGMGNSIILDPYDIFRLTGGLNLRCEELLADRLELNVVDGIILPNLKMVGDGEQCSFLDERGRCSIHALRPGICRLFPLGRYYENHAMYYFLQTGECRKEKQKKVKVWKWIDTPDLKQYEHFVVEWHYFLNRCEELTIEGGEETARQLNLYLLRQFYLKPYDSGEAFEPQFGLRLEEAKQLLAALRPPSA